MKMSFSLRTKAIRRAVFGYVRLGKLGPRKIWDCSYRNKWVGSNGCVNPILRTTDEPLNIHHHVAVVQGKPFSDPFV